MGKSDFLRNYTSVNKYYFASNTPTESDGQPVSVADPVYVRKQGRPDDADGEFAAGGPFRAGWGRSSDRVSPPVRR